MWFGKPVPSGKLWAGSERIRRAHHEGKEVSLPFVLSLSKDSRVRAPDHEIAFNSAESCTTLTVCPDVMQRIRQMVLEVAILDVKPGHSHEFEAAFIQAQTIISSMKGYISHQLQKCVEKPDRYILLVNWQTLEDHTLGFRGSAAYQEWRGLLHRFYDSFPEVEHYELVAGD